MSIKYLRNFTLMTAILKYILLRKCLFVLAIKGIQMGNLSELLQSIIMYRPMGVVSSFQHVQQN